MKTHVLVVCSQNRLRSPTAEQVFADWPGIEVASAGLDDGVVHPVTLELLKWADTIFVMEGAHRTLLNQKFKPQLRGRRVICLGIPDTFRFMDPALVTLLKQTVPHHLGRRARPVRR